MNINRAETNVWPQGGSLELLSGRPGVISNSLGAWSQVCRVIGLLLLAGLFLPRAMYGVDETISARWADLGWIEEEKVSVFAVDGSTIEGRGTAASMDSLLLKKGRQIDRSNVSEIRVYRYNRGRWGRRIGGLAGLAGALFLLGGLGSCDEACGAGAGAILLGGAVGLPVAGYQLGKRADKHVTVIRVIPEETEQDPIEQIGPVQSDLQAPGVSDKMTLSSVSTCAGSTAGYLCTAGLHDAPLGTWQPTRALLSF